MATESDENMDYHMYIKFECLVTVNFVADAFADLIYYFLLLYYKFVSCLQHFVLDNQKVLSSVSSLCPCLHPFIGFVKVC